MALKNFLILRKPRGGCLGAPGDRQGVVVRVHCGEGVAIHTGPKSCVDDPRGRGEALTGDRIGQPLSRESLLRGAHAVETAEGNTVGA
jgi:hypothetical protein